MRGKPYTIHIHPGAVDELREAAPVDARAALLTQLAEAVRGAVAAGDHELARVAGATLSTLLPSDAAPATETPAPKARRPGIAKVVSFAEERARRTKGAR